MNLLMDTAGNILERLLDTHPWGGGGAGGEALDQYLGAGELLQLLKVWPCLGHQPQFIILLEQNNDIMNAILF